MHEKVRQFLGGVWPDNPQVELVWPMGPIAQSLPDFRVCRIGPRQSGDPWIYATVGAFEASAEQVEFVLIADAEDVMHVETLTIITHFHSTRRALTEGSVVNLGRPWIEGAPEDYIAVTASDLSDAGDVRYLTLTPITREQAASVRTNGISVLEPTRA